MYQLFDLRPIRFYIVNKDKRKMAEHSSMKTTVLIVRHSHAKRLGEFVRSHSSARNIPNDFGVEGVNVKIFGVGGPKI